LAIAVLAVATVVGLQTLTDRYERSVVREELLDPAARRARTVVSGPLNYLLVGSDQRSGAADASHRADTILMVHVPAGLDRGYLISIPRDLLVQIPAAPNGYPGGSDKVNAAYQHGGAGEGGARLLSATLTRLTGVRFDGAALIDFSGFRTVIDLLGGVRMCVRTPVRSIHTDTLFPAGCQRMDGARALDFARQRYGLPGGDYDRQRHQQQLLRAMLDQAGRTDLRTNPVRLDQVIRAVGASLTVDTNGVPLEDLILALHGLRADGLLGVRLPSYPETIDEVSYVVLENGGNGLFESLRTTRLPQWAQANPRWVEKL
jgi:LCP family protein required for cell wall assembly